MNRRSGHRIPARAAGRFRRPLRASALAPAGLAIGLFAIGSAAPPRVLAQEPPFPIAAWSRTTAVDETLGALAERGAAVFNNWCSACHSRGAMNAPGTMSLENKYQGSLPAALEDREDLTPELIELYVRNGVATMPFYRKTELGDDDLEALAAYLADGSRGRL
jgi:(+)-pinoresinol hydroxylase